MGYVNKISGIYKIENKTNKKIYIGQTINFKHRKSQHFSNLRSGCHKNPYLQNAFNKHGNDVFIIELLEECHLNDLDELEMKYIAKYDSTNRENGYNIEIGGVRGGKPNIIGEKNVNAQFSDEVALQIIEDLLNGMKVNDIANKNNVSTHSVYNIKHNQSYKHLKPEIRNNLKLESSVEFIKKEKLNKAVVMYLNGMSQNQISKELNISRRNISIELKRRGIDTKLHKNQFVKTQANTEITNGSNESLAS